MALAECSIWINNPKYEDILLYLPTSYCTYPKIGTSQATPIPTQPHPHR